VTSGTTRYQVQADGVCDCALHKQHDTN